MRHAAAIVFAAQIVLHEGHQPDALADLRDADVLPGKDVAEIHLLPFEANPAAVGHGDRLIVKRVRPVALWKPCSVDQTTQEKIL